MSFKIVPANSSNNPTINNSIKEKQKSANCNDVINKYFFSCCSFSSKSQEINIVQVGVDIFELIDKIKILLPNNDSIDAEYRSQLSDLAITWVMLTKLIIKNYKAARLPNTIKDFNKKGSSPILIVEFNCIYDNNLSKVCLKFSQIDEDNPNPKVDVIGDFLKSIKDIFDKDIHNPSSKTRNLTYYPSNQIGIEAGVKTFNSSIPSSEVKWNDVESDETFSKLVFSGCGQAYVMRCKEIHSRKLLIRIFLFIHQ